jgi:hypothetical protein
LKLYNLTIFETKIDFNSTINITAQTFFSLKLHIFNH